jgi:hypothetical protein
LRRPADAPEDVVDAPRTTRRETTHEHGFAVVT